MAELWQAVNVDRDGTLLLTLDAVGTHLVLTVSDADQWEEPTTLTRAEALELRDALDRWLGS